MDFKNGLGGLLKQAQQMQKNLETAQKELADLEAVGEAGVPPLTVKVTLNGQHQCKKVDIAEPVLKESKDFLEDLIAAAFNAGLRKVEETSRQKMASLMGDIKMPEGFPNIFGGGQGGTGAGG